MQVDPYATTNALGRGFDMAQGMAQSRASRQAGSALASGDRQGAMNALGGAGMLGEVEALAQNDRRAEQMQREQQSSEMDDARQFLLRAGTALRTAPVERRAEVYQMLRPTLAQIYPPDVLTRLDQTDLSDQNLDSLLSALGGETQRFNTSQAVVEIGPGGSVRELYSTPENPLDRQYREAQIAAQVALAEQRKAAMARGARPPGPSGSSGRSSGGSRPSTPAPRSGTGTLPPGFTIRRR